METSNTSETNNESPQTTTKMFSMELTPESSENIPEKNSENFLKKDDEEFVVVHRQRNSSLKDVIREHRKKQKSKDFEVEIVTPFGKVLGTQLDEKDQ